MINNDLFDIDTSSATFKTVSFEKFKSSDIFSNPLSSISLEDVNDFDFDWISSFINFAGLTTTAAADFDLSLFAC